MKKIINGKTYDTETADVIAEESFSHPGDLCYTFQILYRTKKGHYFFHGGGGPLSEYAQYLGNNSTDGSQRIWVPDENKLKSWLSSVDVEKMLELFSGDIEKA